MKMTTRFSRRLGLLLLAMLILAVLCLPATAAENEDTYGLAITLTFSDYETVEHTVEDYHTCTFLIQDSSSRYLVAKLDNETGIYHVAGTVTAEAAATRFRGGNNPDDPTMLQLDGLSEGSYTLINYEVPTGFLLMRGIVIAFSPEGAVVGDEIAEVCDSGLVNLTLYIAHGFDLPGGYIEPWRYYSFYACLIVFVISLLVLVIMLVVFLIQAARKFLAQSQEHAKAQNT